MIWNGDKIIADAEAEMNRRVARAAIHLQNRIRENISIPSRTVKLETIKSGKREGDTKKVLGARGSNRGRAGEFPHKDYGTLRARVAIDLRPKELRALVGTNVIHGRHLELGTKKMRPRPWLRRTLDEERETIRQIIAFGSASNIRVG